MGQDYQCPPQSSTSQPGKPATEITGSIPGVLDPTQPGRLCGHPDSKLSFASFDPHAASSERIISELRRPALCKELCRPKRVVVETTPSGDSFWRFVPNARRDEDTPDEGEWPRVIEICGQLIHCSQDQWDIYKLDPMYDCHVRAFPNRTMVTYKWDIPQQAPPEMADHKRHPSSPVPEDIRPQKSSKKPRLDHGSNSDQEYSEVEQMIIDDEVDDMIVDEIPQIIHEPASGERKRKDVEDMQRQTQAPTSERSDIGTHGYGWNTPRGKGQFNRGRRFSSSQPLRNGANYVPTQVGKRVRTQSPSSARRELCIKRHHREKARQGRQGKGSRQQENIDFFLFHLHVPNPEAMNDLSQGSMDAEAFRCEKENQDSSYVNPEASHSAAIEESRRKLAELEADRPLWEAAAAKRRLQELEEEARQKARREAAAAEKAEQEEKRRKEEERRAQARQEAKKKEQEQLRREKERRQRQSWSYGRWTEQRAMERYLELSNSFDDAKFCAENPLTSDEVPWPVLQSPRAFSVEDVTWQAVEEFFEAFRSKMRTQDFKTLIEKSHRRFHPDRWRSRSLLISVADEVERGCMEVAANTVAQALTPMWQQLRTASRR